MKESNTFNRSQLSNEDKDSLSLPLLDLQNITREKILNYFENTWALTELLFSGLKGEKAFYLPPYHNLRHPLIFYYCHPVVFYINKLRLSGIIQEGINAYFEQLFEMGVDEMSWDDMSKNTMQWPGLEEIKRYRIVVYDMLKLIIKTHPAFNLSSISQADSAWAFILSLEHERIHLETSSVLIRELPIHLVKKPNSWPELLYISNTPDNPKPGIDYPVNTMITVPTQLTTLGKNFDSNYYGWDNEYGQKTIENKEFETGQYVISNGEFLQFIKSQGYHEPKYWSDKGWKWRCFQNTKHPTFWVPDGPDGLHHYKLRTCFEIIDMQWSWPVIVNYYEAKAYCAFMSEQKNEEYRLITEAEHHCLREKNTLFQKNSPKLNINLKYGSECPVNAFHPNAYGFYHVFGNVWQWLEDHFSPLPGFKIHPYYSDFSTPCFDGEHQMIMGGSFMSTGDETTPWARFHFRPHFFQHAGFRVIKGKTIQTSCINPPAPFDSINCSHTQSLEKTTLLKNNTTGSPSSFYESENSINEYLLLHYGNHADTAVNLASTDMSSIISPEFTEFPKRCADLITEHIKIGNIEPIRFLDIGCAVGRVCFDLSHQFQDIVGIDNSTSFIKIANQLKSGETIHYLRKEEGEIYSPLSVKLNKSPEHYTNVHFRIEDANNLPESLGKFNVILMANVLCRTENPEKILRLLTSSGFIAQGGILILLSPYSWLKQFTSNEVWLGGMQTNDKPIFSQDTIKNILNHDLILLKEFEMPWLIREHARKFQMIISHGMIWQKQ